MTDNATVGRQHLLDWADAQPNNAYTADTHFKNVLSHYAPSPGKIEEDLIPFGEHVVGVVDELVRENNLFENNPRLNRYTGLGERIEEIAHHPTYHETGKYIYGSGVMAAYADHPNSIGVLSRMYISSYNGEAGHNCPLACTAGVIRVLQEIATDDIREKFLPRFLDRNYDNRFSGAQFLTEVQGGSDVGANAVRAVAQDDGSWKIYGEKWFCSNVDADVFLMTARPEGGETGTSGLGLFLVARQKEDGTVNDFEIRRLKDKLGTRSMASGEFDFVGATGYHMGDLGDGFKHMLNLVINTSRIFNAVSVCGSSRRAYVTAQTYAQHRQAFGQKIGNYPLVQETLANTKAELDGMLSSSFYTVAMQDKIDRGEASDQEIGFQRFAVNLNKMETAKSNRWCIVNGIEILGGNGAIETFSVLPRLLRDAIVCENWEGTHNTLIMQLYRDSGRRHIHKDFFSHLRALMDPCLGETAATVRKVVDECEHDFEKTLEMDHISGPVTARDVLDRTAYAFWAAVRLNECHARGEESEDSLDQFVDHRLDTIQRDDAYFARIARISQTL